MASILKERESAAKKMYQELAVYSEGDMGGLTSSYRGAVSGFDMNMVHVLLVFSFNSAEEGRFVGKKYLSYEGGNKLSPISHVEAQFKINNKQNSDYGLVIIEESNGQLGPTDYKCYVCLEQIIYSGVMYYYAHYKNGAIGEYQEVCIGTKSSFALAALKDKSKDAYRRVEGFLERINGLSFTTKKAVGFAYVSENGAKPIAEDGFFKPFMGCIYEGRDNGKQKLYLKVSNRLILNILYGGTKMQYNEIVNSISNPKSKHLWKMLCLLDQHSNPFFDYSKLVEIFGLQRCTTMGDAAKQIGRIAKPINYDTNKLNILIPKKGSKDRPFTVHPINGKGDYRFYFFLNSAVTPSMQTYVPGMLGEEAVRKKVGDWKKLLRQVRDDAAEHDLAPEEYLVAYGDVLTERLETLSQIELDRLIRHFDARANRHCNMGKEFENLFPNPKEAKKGLAEFKRKIREAENQRKSEQVSVVVKVKRKRGRPRKAPYIEPDQELPF